MKNVIKPALTTAAAAAVSIFLNVNVAEANNNPPTRGGDNPGGGCSGSSCNTPETNTNVYFVNPTATAGAEATATATATGGNATATGGSANNDVTVISRNSITQKQAAQQVGNLAVYSSGQCGGGLNLAFGTFEHTAGIGYGFQQIGCLDRNTSVRFLALANDPEERAFAFAYLAESSRAAARALDKVSDQIVECHNKMEMVTSSIRAAAGKGCGPQLGRD